MKSASLDNREICKNEWFAKLGKIREIHENAETYVAHDTNFEADGSDFIVKTASVRYKKKISRKLRQSLYYCIK